MRCRKLFDGIVGAVVDVLGDTDGLKGTDQGRREKGRTYGLGSERNGTGECCDEGSGRGWKGVQQAEWGGWR
jgi:hypothetical protein